MNVNTKYKRIVSLWVLVIISWIVITLSMQTKTINSLSKERVYLRDRLFSEMNIRQHRETVIALQTQRHKDYEKEIAWLKLHTEMARADLYISKINRKLTSDNRRRIVAAVYGCTLKNHMDPIFVLAVMEQESRFNIFAKSDKDARGLMQLLPSTALNELGIRLDDIYNIESNICGGIIYLRRHLTRYNGAAEVALRRYYGGGELWEYPRQVLHRYAKILKEARR